MPKQPTFQRTTSLVLSRTISAVNALENSGGISSSAAKALNEILMETIESLKRDDKDFVFLTRSTLTELEMW